MSLYRNGGQVAERTVGWFLKKTDNDRRFSASDIARELQKTDVDENLGETVNQKTQTNGGMDVELSK